MVSYIMQTASQFSREHKHAICVNYIRSSPELTCSIISVFHMNESILFQMTSSSWAELISFVKNYTSYTPFRAINESF